MENQVASEVKKNKYLLIIAIYLLNQFIVGSLIIIMMARNYSSSNNLDYDILIKFLDGTRPIADATENYLKAYGHILSISNLIIYSISLAFIIGFLYKDFKNDFIDLTKRPKFYALFIPIATVVFTIISICFDLLLQNVGNSNNQNTIVSIIKNGGAVPMIIAVVLMAPIIEEFVYRKSIFKLLDFAPIWVSYLVSTLFFTIPHMISTPIDGNFGLWLLRATPYVFAGVSFSFIYHKSNKNIYATIAVHMINNLISVILVLAGV